MTVIYGKTYDGLHNLAFAQAFYHVIYAEETASIDILCRPGQINEVLTGKRSVSQVIHPAKDSGGSVGMLVRT